LESKIRKRSAVLLTACSLLTALTLLFSAWPIAQADSGGRQRTSLLLLFFAGLGISSRLLDRSADGARDGKSRLQAAAFFLAVYATFQVLPLPLSLVRVVSPARAELADALGSIFPRNSWVTLSVAPATTVFHGMILAACAIVLSTIYQILRTWSQRPWVAIIPLFAFALLESCLGLLPFPFFGNSGATGTFAIRNHFAGFLEMVLPFAALYPAKLMSSKPDDGIRTQDAVRVCLSSGLAILILVAIALSLSRMGFVTSFISLIAVTLIAFLRYRWHNRPKSIMVLAIAVFASALIMPASLILRFADIQQEGRVPIWRETLHLIRAYPLFGCGLGGYLSAFVKFKQSGPSFTQDYAHNDYLQYLSELGLVGFAIALSLLTLIFAGLRRGWDGGEPDIQWLSLACAGSLSAIALHSFVDFNLYVPANMVTLAWILGVAAYCGTSPSEARSREKTSTLTIPA
jgi:O-antigen ligase